MFTYSRPIPTLRFCLSVCAPQIAERCSHHQEVIQLLHAAMACLAGKRPSGFPQNLVQSCQMAKSIVDGFRRELLMLLNDLCGSEMLREGKEKDGEIFRGPKWR